MSKLIAILLLLLPLQSLAKESCTLESIGLNSKSALAERLFYTGTCNYRNANYEKAVHSWVQLANLKNIDPELIELQIDVLNNLGFMMFFGHGIEEDKQKAISYWKKAVSLGHTESEYHLCHAYADRGAPTYNPKRAMPHCKKAKLLYQSKKIENEDEKVIINQINKYMDQLEA